jgi:hypothetical protein
VGNDSSNGTDLKGLQAPVSIGLTPPGRTPFITANPPKANQSSRTEPNTNPWLSRGGPNRKTGEPFYRQQALEWVITFDGPPCNGKWGKDVWVNGAFLQFAPSFEVRADGTVQLLAEGTDDTDPPHDYVLGNSVYMYDGPGQATGGDPHFIFRVWAKSCDGKTSISKWFYSYGGGTGKMYEIPVPVSPVRRSRRDSAPRVVIPLLPVGGVILDGPGA